MKKLIFTILALVVAINSYASDTIRTNAKINAVDLYPDGAKLYMRASVDLKKGVNRIEIVDIPFDVYGTTLRVNVAGSGIAIHSSLIETKPTIEVADECILKFDAEIAASRKNTKLNKLKISTIDEQIAVLKKQCSVTDEATPNVEYVASVVDVLGEKMNTLQVARYELSAKNEANIKEISAIESRKSDYLRKRNALSRVIAIIVESDQDKSANIAAEFVASGASWSPYYEVHISGGKCEVVTKAKVKQSIGLDWNKIDLTLLSSNIKTNSTDLPVVHSLYIPMTYLKDATTTSVYGSRSVSGVKMYEVDDDEMIQEIQANEDAMQRTADYPMQTSPTMAMPTNSYNMQNYKLSTPYSVANGGSLDIKLTSMSVPVTVDYLIMPIVSQETYLVANLTTPDMFNNAWANIYLEGTFIGTQSLAPYQMDENNRGVVTKLSLGVDKDVIFSTIPQNFTKGNLQTTARQIKVVNNKKSAVNVKVVEVYPISTTSAVKVEDLVISEGYTDGNSKGVINWLVTIEPNQSVTKSISYNVRDNRK